MKNIIRTIGVVFTCYLITACSVIPDMPGPIGIPGI
jgi:hypothetical protein